MSSRNRRIIHRANIEQDRLSEEERQRESDQREFTKDERAKVWELARVAIAELHENVEPNINLEELRRFGNSIVFGIPSLYGASFRANSAFKGLDRTWVGFKNETPGWLLPNAVIKTSPVNDDGKRSSDSSLHPAILTVDNRYWRYYGVALGEVDVYGAIARSYGNFVNGGSVYHQQNHQIKSLVTEVDRIIQLNVGTSQ